MTQPELHISKRLQDLLPSLTDEERKQLKANIVADGRVTDPILHWHDGKKNVVVDGMHRFDIARRGNHPYKTEELRIGGNTYEDVELWMLNRALGRRNLLSPQAQRKLRGELYNRLKQKDGGKRGPGGQFVPTVEGSPVSAAETVAEAAGVDPKTIKRDGAYVDILKKCSDSVQKGINSSAFKASKADVQILSKLNEVNQDNIASDLRKGHAKSVKEAMEKRKIKLPGKKKTAKKPAVKGDYGKCPNCAGTKWKDTEDGIVCAKCGQVHGEPAGDADEDRVKTQKAKSRKTAEALIRAFDDLQVMRAQTCKPCQLTEEDSKDPIRCCKRLVEIAKSWR